MMDFKRFGLIGLGVGVLFVGSLAQYSFGFGAHISTFSAVSILGPLLGLALGFWEIACILVLYAVASTVLNGTLFLPFLTTFGLPTLIASYVLGRGHERFSNPFLREGTKAALYIGLPFLGMILFALHPIGKDALLYTCYWFIPIVVYGYEKIKSGSISWYATALSSTFLAHVVGSVIYLYRFSFTPHYWISLIPLVAVERAVIAGGIVLFVFGIRLFTIFKILSKREQLFTQ